MTAEVSSYSPTAGLPFDDKELESKLVWIWGSPRTGSTWLLEMPCYPLEASRMPRWGSAGPRDGASPSRGLPSTSS